MRITITELEKIVGLDWLDALESLVTGSYIEGFELVGEEVVILESDAAEIRYMFEQFSTSNEVYLRKKPWCV
jgi:hypothetical protein